MRAVARQLKRGLVDLYWTFRGPGIRVAAIPKNPRSILFVCKGNICRSPFAEHLARNLVIKGKEGCGEGIIFRSAGLHVIRPIAPPETAIVVARQFGVSLEFHRSQPLSEELLDASDLIIAMEGWQHAEMRDRFVAQQEKLFLLPLLTDNGIGRQSAYETYNIQDPYGGSPQAFERCFERIEKCIKALLVGFGARI